jgi:titin
MMLLLALLLWATVGSAATLTWTDNSVNELGFNIQRKIASQGCAGPELFGPLADTPANATSDADAPTVEGNRYAYRVRAWNTTTGTPTTGTRQYSDWSNCADVAYPYTAASAPSALAVKAGVLTWTDRTTTETGFKIERKAVSCAASDAFVVLATVGANVVTYADGAVAAGTTYCYQVRAVSALGDSPPSNTAEYLAAIPGPNAAPSNLTIQ